MKYIVILNTADAVSHFTTPGKIDWNATATGTAGSNTTTEKVSTTELEHWELVVYKDSAGIFGGATFGGTSVERQDKVNQAAYGEFIQTGKILDGTVPAPKLATHLFQILDGQIPARK